MPAWMVSWECSEETDRIFCKITMADILGVKQKTPARASSVSPFVFRILTIFIAVAITTNS
jgi:hypothetical protein